MLNICEITFAPSIGLPFQKLKIYSLELFILIYKFLCDIRILLVKLIIFFIEQILFFDYHLRKVMKMRFVVIKVFL